MGELTPREIAQTLRQFTADATALENQYLVLVNQYPKQWVGVFNGELRIGETLDDVLAYFGCGGRVAVKYLDPTPKTWILAHAS